MALAPHKKQGSQRLQRVQGGRKEGPERPCRIACCGDPCLAHRMVCASRREREMTFRYPAGRDPSSCDGVSRLTQRAWKRSEMSGRTSQVVRRRSCPGALWAHVCGGLSRRHLGTQAGPATDGGLARSAIGLLGHFACTSDLAFGRSSARYIAAPAAVVESLSSVLPVRPFRVMGH